MARRVPRGTSSPLWMGMVLKQVPHWTRRCEPRWRTSMQPSWRRMRRTSALVTLSSYHHRAICQGRLTARPRGWVSRQMALGKEGAAA